MTAVKGNAAVTTIKDSAFTICKALKSFPTLNKLQTVGASVFKSCVKLTKFTIGKNIKKGVPKTATIK